jgi:hypothetical protein
MVSCWDNTLRRDVESCIQALQSGPPCEQRDIALATYALPVYADLGGHLVLTVDGLVCVYSADTHEMTEVDDRLWQLIALRAAGKEYPRLSRLVPVRPEGAEDCLDCAGTGQVSGKPVICGSCAGLGWHDRVVGCN